MQNELQLTYSNLKFSKYFRGRTPDTPLYGEEVRVGEMGNGEGKGEENGLERKEGKGQGREGNRRVGKEALPKQKFTITPVVLVPRMVAPNKFSNSSRNSKRFPDSYSLSENF